MIVAMGMKRRRSRRKTDGNVAAVSLHAGEFMLIGVKPGT